MVRRFHAMLLYEQRGPGCGARATAIPDTLHGHLAVARRPGCIPAYEMLDIA